MRRIGILAGVALAAALAIAPASAQQPQPTRVVGKITAVDGSTITVKTAQGDEKVVLPGNVMVIASSNGTIADVKKGDYIGVGAAPQADGSQTAIRVNIVAEPQRGVGEGFRPWTPQHHDQRDGRYHGLERRRAGGDGQVQGRREEGHHRV